MIQWRSIIIVSCLGSVLVLAACLGLDENVRTAKAGETEVSVAATAEALSTAYRMAGRAIQPSVVNISSVKIVRQSMQGFSDSPLRDFFGDEMLDRLFRDRMPREGMKQTGLGTGVIVSEEGHILTNNHVVSEMDEVTVRHGDQESRARVVGTDPRTDLAVIKIDAGPFTPARLGNSDYLEPGELVLAMGNSFGLSETLTAGIVSAKGRANMDIVEIEDFIQTDAAINPGNSGGPLVNLRGEVVGINTAIFSRTGGNMGIGFAIPINMARSVLESIMKDGKVVRGHLGVQIQNLTPGLARSFGYEGTEGALIAQVLPDSPAARAGLREGDIITRVGEESVKDTTQLRNKIAALKPESRVEMEVFREGDRRKISVEVGELDGVKEERGTVPDASMSLGMALMNITPQLAKQLGEPEELTGVIVTAVQPGGIADRGGVRPKDIVLSVQEKAVKDVEDFRKEIEKADLEQGVRLKVRRERGTSFYLFLTARD